MISGDLDVHPIGAAERHIADMRRAGRTCFRSVAHLERQLQCL
jgi:hypothetical protein